MRRASSRPGCPVQAFRIGANVYATQFHPELDAEGLCTRIDVYKHAGYFQPEEADELKALAYRSNVSHPPGVLRRFVQRYAGDALLSQEGASQDGAGSDLSAPSTVAIGSPAAARCR